MIEKRPFGRTGHMSTVAIFGGAALMGAGAKEADRALEILLEFGVNHIDTAPRYGDSEVLIGDLSSGRPACWVPAALFSLSIILPSEGI